MKVGIKFGKVKKFGIGWCIPHRVVVDNAEGVRATPASYRRIDREKTMLKEILWLFCLSL